MEPTKESFLKLFGATSIFDGSISSISSSSSSFKTSSRGRSNVPSKTIRLESAAKVDYSVTSVVFSCFKGQDKYFVLITLTSI